MQPSNPSAGRSSAPAAPAAAPAGTEIVTRPEPGLARGRWEAPSWFFWAALALIVASAAAYLLRRLGILRLSKAPSGDTPPASTRMRRP
jgi:hypothetical protein